MAKRNIDDLQPLSPRIGARRGTKRQRAEEFLERTANFEHTLRTCRFFLSHLDACSEALCHDMMDGKLGCPTSSSIRNELQRLNVAFEMKHRFDCSRTRQEARNAIQLAEAFQEVSSGIEGRNVSPLLDLLNLGPEATYFLKQNVSEYAGVPGQGELLDWKNLDSLLR